MDTLFLKIVIILYLSENSYGVKDHVKSDDRKASREREYCQFETFSPQCRKDQVIVIDKALYGRMKLSRCVQNDYGYLGCQTNVIDILSKNCSGVRTCSYSVPDLRKLSEACPNDLIVYLSATYSCLNVINSQSCSKENPTTLTVTELSGYISSYYAYQNGTGSPNCPILIKASPGQKINITIRNFGDDSFGGDSCPHHIIVKDGEYVETMNLCHDLGKMGGNNYLSTSHSLRIFFSGLTGLKSRHLIHYKVIGCKPLIPPGDATFELTGEGRGSVKCGQTVWYVTCDSNGNRWTGQVGNCTKGLIPANKVLINGHIIHKTKGTKPKSAFSLGLVLAVTIGMVLGLLLGSALLIIVLMRKKKRRRRCVQLTQKGNTLLGGDANTFDSEEHYYRHTCQANNCDGRCVAPTTYCGQNRIYNPVTHNYIQDVEMMQTNSPCQAHAIYAKRPLVESPYNTTPRKLPTPQTNNKFASILSSKPSNKQSTTTFTTFKPSEGDGDCLYDRFSTYQSRRGIIKMPTDSGTVCTCDKADDQTTTTNNVAPKPDVVQTNHTDAENNSTNDGTATLKKPQVILLPKTNNAKPT